MNALRWRPIDADTPRDGTPFLLRVPGDDVQDLRVARWFFSPRYGGGTHESFRTANFSGEWRDNVSVGSWTGVPDGALWCPLFVPVDDNA